MSDDLQARNRELEQQLRQCQQELQQAKAAQQLAESRLAAERQQFERSLQHSEAKCQQVEAALCIANDEMQALFTAMDDLVLVRDAEGRCLKILTSKNHPLLYQPADFIIGRTLHEVFPQDRADLIWNSIQQALTQGQPVKIEYSLPIQGEEIWFDTTISPLPIASAIK
ncbi:PAS domain-containing protein [Leptodesmis sichuanensis]|uniref:PAS domain-containing protein n=1 Tax=Leptodesmis sichuanensis TaxID=2906798 RepID=UPI001F20034D|nr:PAS domain-containing protein [Leptodesmis sichuanensis]UIE39855.1 PAS domain-containing protein [Leptodesmis sichuanensis A121]